MTISTVPNGGCFLCDPSGYRELSGPSMATPHVAEVAAALFARHPHLSALEVRDILLDPRSLDPIGNPSAPQSTSGGKLNFYKALQNPLIQNPKLNGFPSILEAKDVAVSAGGTAQTEVKAFDPDRDLVRTAILRPGAVHKGWLYETMLARFLPNSMTNRLQFRAPDFAIPIAAQYFSVVADGRGGSAKSKFKVSVTPKSQPGRPPVGKLTAFPTAGPAGTEVEVRFDVQDPEGGSTLWDLATVSRNGAGKYCCNSAPSYKTDFRFPGVYRLNAQAIDSELLLSRQESVVVRIGGATGEPPLAQVSTSQTVGQVPLRVQYDLSASSDLDGKVTRYNVNCGNGQIAIDSSSPKGECLFTEPGPYAIRLIVQDNDSHRDAIYVYAMAL